MELVQYKAGLLNLQRIVPLHSETGLGYSNQNSKSIQY